MKKFNLFLITALLLSGFSQLKAQNITVNYNNKKQLIDLMGTDMERSASFLQSAANSQEIADWCFKDINFDVCRVSYDKKQELEEGNPNFAFYDKAIASMKMVKIANPDVKFLATMKSDYNGYNSQNNLPEWICNYKPTTWFNTTKYAAFLADYLEIMHSNNVTITYLALAKEWSVVNVNRSHQIIAALNNECTNRGVPQPLYVCPASWSVSQGISFVNTVGNNNGYADNYYAFSTHNLNNQTHLFDDFVNACHSLGKPAYNDESGYGAGGRTNGVEPETIETLLNTYGEKAEMYKSGIQGEIPFEIFSRGISSETRSIYFTSGAEGKRMRSYYILQQFANNTYLRNYIPPTTSGFSDVKTMAFANDDEIAIWVINSSDSDYSSVNLGLNNTTVNGAVHQYSWDVDSKIQGVASIVSANSSNQYTCNIKANSINLFKVYLSGPAANDDITLYGDALDFGTIDLKDAGNISNEFLFSIDKQSTNVTLSISCSNANAFSIAGQTTYSSETIIHAEPVSVVFNPSGDGVYNAILTITSGSNTKQIELKGEAYESQVVEVPFEESFSSLVANSSSLTTSQINSYSDYKGWQVHNGTSSGANRMRVASPVGDDDIGYFLTPEITFDGPFELSFYARPVLNNIGTTLSQNENNKFRNIYAVIGNDTIYDHHKAGSVYFQNYNKWKCTYSYEGTARIKFFGVTKNQGDWVGKTDGLIFGAKDDKIRVQATTSPTVNIGYGHAVEFGEIIQSGTTLYKNFILKGWNLTDGLTITPDGSSSFEISSENVSPNQSGEVYEEVYIGLNTSALAVGKHTEKLTLSSDNGELKSRTIWLNYEVTNSTGISFEEYAHNVYTQDNSVVIDAAYPCQVEIFNISGQRIIQESDVLSTRFELNPGLYLVKLGNETHKVIIM